MFARLGFAVATAHVPEILILDEILSVGDEAFQRKCNNRMKSFQQAGTTVLMVSHALDTLEGMCDRLAWIDHGKILKIDEPRKVIAAYRGENW
jgi:ABC-type polysaccharide/polyol phosphate transport system ATPase subunit